VSPRSGRTYHQPQVGDRKSQQHASFRSYRPAVSPERPRSDQGQLGPGHVITGTFSGQGMDPSHAQTPGLRGLSVIGQTIPGQPVSGQPVSGHHPILGFHNQIIGLRVEQCPGITVPFISSRHHVHRRGIIATGLHHRMSYRYIYIYVLFLPCNGKFALALCIHQRFRDMFEYSILNLGG
jgi:hypothetical protein